MTNVFVIGAVNSTAHTIRGLHKHGFDIVGVLGHAPPRSTRISGWCDLGALASELKVSYRQFDWINDSGHLDWAKTLDIDLIFAVGFSQLLSKQWLDVPKLGCIGFHPTNLPRGRGRAPIAWMVLEERQGAATFFLMGEGADDGPIFVQEPFSVDELDDAESVGKKILSAIDTALDRWLPELRGGHWHPIPQDEAAASYFGIRKPPDGIIKWDNTACSIDRLIKATTRPYPGAYTYSGRQRLIVYKSEVETRLPIQGAVGRVLRVEGDHFLVQCGIGLIWISDITPSIQLRVGDKLGINVEDEIAALWRHLERVDE